MVSKGDLAREQSDAERVSDADVVEVFRNHAIAEGPGTDIGSPAYEAAKVRLAIAAPRLAREVVTLRADVATLTKAKADLLDIAERATVQRDKAEVERDAWAVLARAERRSYGAAMFGSPTARADAFHDVVTAKAALRALGIDPDAAVQS